MPSLINIVSNAGSASASQQKLYKLNNQIKETEEKLKSIIEEKMSCEDDEDDERLSTLYKETKKLLNELKRESSEIETNTYDAFVSENRSKELIELLKNLDTDECYLKLIDRIIVGNDNTITIIDYFGAETNDEEISKNIKNIQDFSEILHGFYSSPVTGKVYKYKIIRLGGNAQWKK